MFERFTKGARRVVVLAQREALTGPDRARPPGAGRIGIDLDAIQRRVEESFGRAGRRRSCRRVPDRAHPFHAESQEGT